MVSWPRVLLIVSLLLNPAGCQPRREDRQSHPDKTPNDSSDAFAESFFTDAHINECVTALDSLRQRARSHIFDGYTEMAAHGPPSARISSGEQIAYSIASDSGSVIHHFSVSRSPYLATPFGRTLIGLACQRFGLPAPELIKVSPLAVYHAEWQLTPSEQAVLVVREIPSGATSTAQIMLEAIRLTSGVELKHFDVDYEKLEMLKGDSNNETPQPPAPRGGG